MKKFQKIVGLIALTVAAYVVAFALSSTRSAGTITATGWTNASNATADDANSATNANSDPAALDATNFGFALASGSVIDSITCRIDWWDDGGASTSVLFKMIKGGSVVGTDNGTWIPIPGDGTEATVNLSGGLWGTTWTQSDINASNFGYRFDIVGDGGSTIHVDFCEITVYYHAGASGTKRIIGMARSLSPVRH
jgi:hypothetical protein